MRLPDAELGLMSMSETDMDTGAERARIRILIRRRSWSWSRGRPPCAGCEEEQMTETSLVVAAEPWRWTIPVNQGAEVHRLADDFIVEIERSSGQVEFEVWEIR